METEQRVTANLVMDAEWLDGILLVRISGELDNRSAHRLGERVRERLEGVGDGPWRVILDLGDVAFIDSSGLGVIAGLWKAATRGGGDLAVARPPRLAQIMLRRTGLDGYIHVAASVPSATRHLSEGSALPVQRRSAG